MTQAQTYIGITKEEYEELIEARAHLNAVYGLINSENVASLKLDGRRAQIIDASTLEIVSGFEQNENYYNKLAEDYLR